MVNSFNTKQISVTNWTEYLYVRAQMKAGLIYASIEMIAVP